MREERVFERVEQKYRLTARQRADFLQAAAGRIQLDQYGHHTIHNIYYDTDTYALIRQSIEGPKYKEKFRVRCYNQLTGDSTVFLEIKKKYRGIVYKRRTALSCPQAGDFLRRGQLPPCPDQVLREIQYFFSFYRPRPALYLAYDREAFTGEDGLRITVDERIRSRRSHISLEDSPQDELLDPSHYIMEIKVPGAYPLWLSQLLSAMQLYPISFSKYGCVYRRALSRGQLTLPRGEHPAPTAGCTPTPASRGLFGPAALGAKG